MGKRSAALPPPRASSSRDNAFQFRCSRALQKAALYSVVGTLVFLYLMSSSPSILPSGQSGIFGGRWSSSSRTDLQALRDVADGDGRDLVEMVDIVSRTLAAQQAQQQQQVAMAPQPVTQDANEDIIDLMPIGGGNPVDTSTATTTTTTSTTTNPATTTTTTTAGAAKPNVPIDDYMTNAQAVGAKIGATECPPGAQWSPQCQACFAIPAAPAMLKFNLVHVPKAAGTAFTIPLRRLLHCAPEGKGCWGDPAVVVNNNINCEGRFTGCYGHNGFAPDAAKMSVALFRHPVGRVRSAFHHDRHLDGATVEEKAAVKQTTTMEEYIRFPGVRNCQTKMILGYRCATRRRMDETQFTQAKQQLEMLDFVGITEHYNTSVCLLFKQVGVLPMDADFTQWRKNANYNHDEPMNPSTQTVIMQEDYYDAHLYARALELFKQRVIEAGLHLLEPASQYSNLPLPATPPEIV